jgi:hypothetical protein
MKYCCATRQLYSHHRRAFTLLEAMVVLTMMSFVVLGGGVGLQSLAGAGKTNGILLWESNQVASTVEALRATAYASVLTGSAVSDSDPIGVTHAITWTATEIDPANPTIAKPGSGLKSVVVKLDSITFTIWVLQ